MSANSTLAHAPSSFPLKSSLDTVLIYQGDVFSKHNKGNGKVVKTKVFVNLNHTAICWEATGVTSKIGSKVGWAIGHEVTSLPLDQIIKIETGFKTQNFLKMPSSRMGLSEMAFSGVLPAVFRAFRRMYAVLHPLCVSVARDI
jgi:hypothetical protein